MEQNNKWEGREGHQQRKRSCHHFQLTIITIHVRFVNKWPRNFSGFIILFLLGFFVVFFLKGSIYCCFVAVSNGKQ